MPPFAAPSRWSDFVGVWKAGGMKESTYTATGARIAACG